MNSVVNLGVIMNKKNSGINLGKTMYRNHPIGVFDSGVGGLTVVAELIKQIPCENIVYFGDTARVPYGEKTPKQIISFVEEIMDFLLKFKVKAVVMACNTSSALAYPNIKEKYDVPIFEMITPAVEEANRKTRNKKIGVIANSATINSNAYKEKLEKFGAPCAVFQQACPLLVPLVERGETESDYAKKILRTYLDPLMAENIDTLILGCTHYPHLLKPINEITGEGVFVLNPAKKAIEKLKFHLEKFDLLKNESRYMHKYFVSGDEEHFKSIAKVLLNSEDFSNIERIQAGVGS